MTPHDHDHDPDPTHEPTPATGGSQPGPAGGPEHQQRRVFYDVDELTQDSRGAWLVRTRHTSHIFHLDAGLYRREPDTGAQRFDGDHGWLALARIEEYPRVGGRFLIWLEPAVNPAWEYWRISSSIRAILGTRLTSAPDAPAWPALPDNLPERLAPPLERAGPWEASLGTHRDSDAESSAPEIVSHYPAVGLRGRWHVTTMDSDYTLDLDAGTATRTPRSAAQPLAGDGRPVRLLSVIKAQLGEPLVLRLDLGRSSEHSTGSASADDDRAGRDLRTGNPQNSSMAPLSPSSSDARLHPPRLVFRYGTPVLRIRPAP